MEPNDSESNTGKYTFIEEKVVARKGKKLKRISVSVATTLVLAALFGFTARYVFEVSGIVVDKLPGVLAADITPTLIARVTEGARSNEPTSTPKPTAKASIAPPSPTPDSTPTAMPSKDISPSPTVTPDITPTSQSPGGIDSTPSVAPTPTPTPTLTPTPTPVIANTEDSLGVLGVFNELTKAIARAKASLVKTTTVENGIDLMNNPYIKTYTSSGTIIKISSDFIYVLTNYFVPGAATYIQITFDSAETVNAAIYKSDRDFGITILSLRADELTEETLSAIRVAEFQLDEGSFAGMPILAIGSPAGIANSVGFGIISSNPTQRSIIDGLVNLLYTDMHNHISDTRDHEDSNGFLIDLNARYLALITQQFSENGGGMITAIDFNSLMPAINRMLSGSVDSYFGVSALDMPEDRLIEYGLSNGIYIEQIAYGSPAFAAGIRAGDILCALDGRQVFSVQSMCDILYTIKPETVVKFSVCRPVGDSYRTITLDVTIKAKEP